MTFEYFPERAPASWTAPSYWPTLAEPAFEDEDFITFTWRVTDYSAPDGVPTEFLGAGTWMQQALCSMELPCECTVDWGDGTVETVATGSVGTQTVVTHEHNYANVPGAFIPELQAKLAIVTIRATGFGGGSFNSGLGRLYLSYYIDSAVSFASSDPSQMVDIIASGTFKILGLYYTPIGQPTGLEPEWLRRICLRGTLPNITSMYNFCRSMQGLEQIELPPFGTCLASCTDWNSCFQNCRKLTEIPDIDMSNISGSAAAYGLYDSCYELNVAPKLTVESLIAAGAATSLERLFYSCKSLFNVDNIDWSPLQAGGTTSVNNMRQMFNFSTIQKGIPNLQPPAGCDTYRIYQTCADLIEVDIDFSNQTAFYGEEVKTCRGLKNLDGLTNMGGFDMDLQQLGCHYTVIDAFLERLPDGTGLTLDLIGCTDTARIDTTIATAKNWTVLT